MIRIRLLIAGVALLWLSGYNSFSPVVSSTQTLKIRVQVRDILSKTPLVGASIRAEGVDFLGITDQDGWATLLLTSVPASLRIHAKVKGSPAWLARPHSGSAR